METQGLHRGIIFDIDSRSSAKIKKQVVCLLLYGNIFQPVKTLKTDALFVAYKSKKRAM